MGNSISKPKFKCWHVGASIAVLVVLLCYLSQDYLVYVPKIPFTNSWYPRNNAFGEWNPGERGIWYEDLEINSEGVKLKGWILLQADSKNCPTIIFYQGNSGNIGWWLTFADVIYQRLNCNVVLCAYWGYSDSEGRPSEKGLKIDGVSILKHV